MAGGAWEIGVGADSVEREKTTRHGKPSRGVKQITETIAAASAPSSMWLASACRIVLETYGKTVVVRNRIRPAL